MKFGQLLVAPVLLLGLAPLAEAHIQLTMPKPRVPNNDAIKYGARPCGGAFNAASVTTFKPGDTVVFNWNETIAHPGYYRIELDTTGDDSFGYVDKATYDDKFYKYFNGGTVKLADLPKEVVGPVDAGNSLWILRDYWGLHDNSAGKKPWTVMVTLPNVTCDRCTLRLTQVMADPGRPYANAFYLHCADIKIAGAAANTGGAGGTANTGGAGGTGGAVATGGTSGSGGMSSTGGASGSGGTSMSTGGTGGKKTGGSSGEGGSQGGQAGGGEAGGGEAGNAGDDDNKKSDGGCNLGNRNTSPGALLLVACPLALALVRRRRRN